MGIIFQGPKIMEYMYNFSFLFFLFLISFFCRKIWRFCFAIEWRIRWLYTGETRSLNLVVEIWLGCSWTFIVFRIKSVNMAWIS